MIGNCDTCTVNSSQFECTGCLSGFVLSANNSCSSACGDGAVVGSEGCDDGNTADGDGCSSNCTVEPAFFCQGAPSACYQCVLNCLDCADNTSCTTCHNLSLWNASTLICEADCSPVVECLSCDLVSNSVNCTGCNYDFSLDTANNVCSEVCGDGMAGGNETCDDGNVLDGDGCSSVCQVESAYFCQNSPSNCYQCVQNCLDCIDNSSCTSCHNLSDWNVTSLTCDANCSPVVECLSCDLVNNSINCTGCNYGYSLDSGSNQCLQVCGDGMTGGNEACDDGNVLDGDGCSSACLIENAYFCEGAPSLCYQCVLNCLDCADNTSCLSCHNLSLWNSSSLVCEADCSQVVECFSCDLTNNSIACSSCNYGYSLDSASNQCLQVCGDGMAGGNETCDDGNTADGDGCSSVCQVESAYFCQNSPSDCYPCLQHCLDCADNSSCANCSALTAYDPSVPACLANCSVIGSCLTCNVSASPSGEFVECLSCSGGYSVDPASNACRPICGDGILAPEEACEDGNTLAGDGCGPSCLVEPHFGCNTSAASNLSECSLVDFGLSFSHLIKHNGANSGSMHFDPSP